MIISSVRDNIVAIEQGIKLIGGLSAAVYTERAALCFNSSAGGHLRHVIEHYLSFLIGAETGEVDYEARARDGLIETDPDYAVGQLRAISERLNRLAVEGADMSLNVRAETTPADAEDIWCRSTVLRELEFLLSHTVHHYALIAVVCRLAGQDVPKDFGVAPSTLRYLQAQTARA
jgi:uncharacterized damage-inducible protein DinB